MIRSLARTCYRRRRIVSLAWVALMAGLVIAAGAGAGEYKSEFGLEGTESQAALELLEAEGFGGRGSFTGQLVVAADVGVDDPAVRAAAESLIAELQANIPDLEVASPYDPAGAHQISPEGTVAYAELNFPPGIDSNDLIEQGEAARELRAEAQLAAPDGVQLELGGDFFAEFPELGNEQFGFLAAIVILLIAFGSLLAMGLPIVTAIFGIGCGLALVQLAANVFTIPSYTESVVLMLGIGVGIDYALFIVTRYRESLHEGLSAEEAVVRAIDTAGRAVLFAGTTVVISVLGMVLLQLSATTALAVSAAFGVLTTMAAALTLLPAILGFVGHNIDRLGLPHRHHKEIDARASFWHRWSRFVQRRPWPVLVVSSAALLVLAIPLFGLRLGIADAGNRGEEDSTRRAYDLLAEGFGPGFNGPLLLATELPNGQADLETFEALSAELAAEPGVAGVSPVIPNEAGSAAILSVFPAESPQSEATGQLVHHLRDDVIPAVTSGSGLDVLVGGYTAGQVDFSDIIGQRMPYFVGAVLILSFLLLMATFRSLLVPLKAVIMNLLSIGAAYGVIVAIFQWGWLSDVFGAEPGPIEAWAPLMLFAIVFGLSMDYEVFLLSRMREEYDRTGDNAVAVADGLASTARVITAAAAIMVCVFGGFVFSDLRAISLIGVGLSAAVLVDATIVRLLLVPATMELLGDRNWWLPSWLDRVLPTLHVEGSSAADVPLPAEAEPEMV